MGHYHTNTDEEYAMLKGQMVLEIYNPATQEKSTVTLETPEF